MNVSIVATFEDSVCRDQPEGPASVGVMPVFAAVSRKMRTITERRNAYLGEHGRHRHGILIVIEVVSAGFPCTPSGCATEGSPTESRMS